MSYNDSGEPIDLGVDIPDSIYEDGKRTYPSTLWGLPVIVTDVVPPDRFIVIGNTEYFTEAPVNKKTLMLEVGITVPVEVAEEALAERVLEILKQELVKTTKREVGNFIVNGVTASLEDVAVKAEKRLQKVGMK